MRKKWKAFAHKIDTKTDDYSTVLKTIKAFLAMPIAAAIENKVFAKNGLAKAASGDNREEIQMEFTVVLERKNSIVFYFEDDEFESVDTNEEELVLICGEILVDNKKIGEIDLYELRNDHDVRDRCDSTSADCASIANVICGKSGNILKKYLSGESKYDSVYILDRITIEKEYRKHGIGSTVVKNLLKMIQYQFGKGSTIFLCASDYEAAKQYGFESNEHKKGNSRLIQFYKKAGFRVVKDNIMVCNPNNT